MQTVWKKKKTPIFFLLWLKKNEKFHNNKSILWKSIVSKLKEKKLECFFLVVLSFENRSFIIHSFCSTFEPTKKCFIFEIFTVQTCKVQEIPSFWIMNSISFQFTFYWINLQARRFAHKARSMYSSILNIQQLLSTRVLLVQQVSGFVLFCFIFSHRYEHRAI